VDGYTPWEITQYADNLLTQPQITVKYFSMKLHLAPPLFHPYVSQESKKAELTKGLSSGYSAPSVNMKQTLSPYGFGMLVNN
jgi:hypothetical protein